MKLTASPPCRPARLWALPWDLIRQSRAEQRSRTAPATAWTISMSCTRPTSSPSPIPDSSLIHISWTHSSNACSSKLWPRIPSYSWKRAFEMSIIHDWITTNPQGIPTSSHLSRAWQHRWQRFEVTGLRMQFTLKG